MINDVCLIIPSYNPDKKLFEGFLNKAVKNFSNIIVINDGSKKELLPIFDEFKERFKTVSFIRHNINLGKGRALKTAFNYYLNNFPDCVGIVQADCDGQHSIEDTMACANAMKENPQNLILGTRNFNDKNVPKKSMLGNKITRNVFKIFVGMRITDTQTGLRAMSNDLVKTFLQTKGERFEYETEMLIDCKANNIKITEVPIQTIYIKKNETSKFNPWKDSVIIYKLFGKYIFASISSFIVDIALFNLFLLLQSNSDFANKILLATVLARILSSLFNFAVNAKMVFKNSSKTSFIKYVALALVQMLISGFAVQALSTVIPWNTTIIKIIVDVLIFIANFIIQREFVFK